MRFVLQDSVERIPFPKQAKEILPFIRPLLKWTCKYFWMRALYFEMCLMMRLFDCCNKLSKIKILEQRLYSLADGTNLLLDKLEMKIVF